MGRDDVDGRRQKKSSGGGAKAKMVLARRRRGSCDADAGRAIPGEEYWPRDQSIKIGL